MQRAFGFSMKNKAKAKLAAKSKREALQAVQLHKKISKKRARIELEPNAAMKELRMKKKLRVNRKEILKAKVRILSERHLNQMYIF